MQERTSGRVVLSKSTQEALALSFTLPTPTIQFSEKTLNLQGLKKSYRFEGELPFPSSKAIKPAFIRLVKVKK